MRSADIVTGALGSDWLEKQRLLTTRPERIISDIHPLYRHLTSSNDQAIVTICELARYIQEFASDSAIGTIVDDLRSDKYESTLLELALAHRWKKAGAVVTLQPPVPGGVADFAAVIEDVRYVVEASVFPADDFSKWEFRAATIVTNAVDSVIKHRLPVAVKIVIRDHIDGDFEGQLRAAVRSACASLLTGLAEDKEMVSQEMPFCSIHVERLTALTERITDSSGAPRPLQASNWDLCVSIRAQQKPPGGFSYEALAGQRGPESVRLFMKLPRCGEAELAVKIAKKLRKEKAQLKGVDGPRIVILHVGALASNGLDMGTETLAEELRRRMGNTPELAGVWLLSEVFPSRSRHQYFGPFVRNSQSVYELPETFLRRLVDHEGVYDFVNDTTDIVP